MCVSACVCVAASFHHLESFAVRNMMLIASSPSLQDLTGDVCAHILSLCSLFVGLQLHFLSDFMSYIFFYIY